MTSALRPLSFSRKAALFALPFLFVPAVAHADIFRWDNHTLITGTAGITPGPGINFNALNLTKANLTGLDLTDATFTGTIIKSAHFRDSDLRGAEGWVANATVPKTNVIQPDGTIKSLSLSSQEILVVRDGDPITVTSNAAGNKNSTLRVVLDDTWTSTLSFNSKAKPSLKGTLNLTFEAGEDPSTLIGHTFDLFNWPKDVPANRQFAHVTFDPSYTWDLSKLYTTGEVTLTAAPSGGAGNVPEPASLGVLGLGAVALLTRRKRA